MTNRHQLDSFRESLTAGSWGPTNASSRFFRVKVELK